MDTPTAESMGALRLQGRSDTPKSHRAPQAHCPIAMGRSGAQGVPWCPRSQQTSSWTSSATSASPTWAWPATSPRRSPTPACECAHTPARPAPPPGAAPDPPVPPPQGHPRVHGAGGAAEGGGLRQQCRLVLTGLHALQAAQGVSVGSAGHSWTQLGTAEPLLPPRHRHSPFRQHKTKDKHEIDRMTLTMVGGGTGGCGQDMGGTQGVRDSWSLPGALVCAQLCVSVYPCPRSAVILWNLPQAVELPDSFSPELRSLLEGLLQRDVNRRLGCMGRG